MTLRAISWGWVRNGRGTLPVNTTPTFPVISGTVWGRWEVDAGITTSGTNVTVWADQSGNARNLSTGSGTPFVYQSTGGKAGIGNLVGAASNLVWQDASPTKTVPSGPCTIYGVFGNTLINGSGSTIFINGANSLLNMRDDAGPGGLLFANYGNGDIGYVFDYGHANANNGILKVCSLRKRPAGATVESNLVPGAGVFVGSPAPMPSFGGIGVITGNLAAIVVVTGDVDNTDNTAIYNYLAAKYLP